MAHKLPRNYFIVLLLCLMTIPANTSVADILLGRPTDESITINAIPDLNGEISFEYGTTSGVYTNQTGILTAIVEKPVEIVISGLSQSTQYYYRMLYRASSGYSWTASEEYEFNTQKDEGQEFTFDITSDSHVDIVLGSLSTWLQTLDNVGDDNPDFLIDLGDTFALDKVSTVSGAEYAYRDQRDYMSDISASVPIFLALGNHEQEEGWHLDDTGNPYTSIPVMAANARKMYYLNPVADGFYSGNTDTYSYLDGDQLREDYYAWEWGDAMFVVIDPYWYTTTKPYTGNMGGGESSDTGSGDRWDWTLGIDQYLWFKNILETSDAKYKFVFSHCVTGGTEDYVRGGAEAVPYCEWGGYNEDGTTRGWNTERPTSEGWDVPVHELMVENRVSAFFHGHDHQYAYEIRDGIVYQALASSGFSGSGFDLYSESDPYTIEVLPGPGHLSVTVSATKATVKYISTYDGSILYSYDIEPVEVGNVAPVAYDQSLSTPVDTALAITLSATDTNGDNLVYNIVSAPSNGILSGSGPNRTYTPDTGFTGTDTFTFKASDCKLNSNIAIVTIMVVPENKNNPKNVIFMIGDGMGFEQVKAAGMYLNGQAGTLSFESFPYTAECSTYSANNSVTDSAAAGTALATGQKVNNDVISVAIPGDGSEIETLLEYFKARGKMTGLVTTTYITHATPASFGAHETSRSNYERIGDDLRTQTKPNVLLGGGANGVTVSEFEAAGYTVVTNRAQMQAVNPNATTYLSGQFGSGDIPYEPDVGNLPHLTEMTVTALDVLDNKPNGFFLMVEGGRIDHAGHSNLRDEMVLETVEFSNSVQAVIDWAKDRDDTLILVTADHETGGLKVTKNNGQGVMPTVTWSTGNHTATNVPVYALGENAFLISGVMDNTDMFFVCTCTPGEGAWNPGPVDGGINNDTKATLGWLASDDGVSFDIYFGTDFNDVNDANNTSVTFMANQEETSYVVGDLGSSYPDALVPGAIYYWRVDEINDVNGINDPNHIYKGDVWSFTVPPEKAWGPDPADGVDGVDNVDANIELSWYPAFGVIAPKPHHVYFGESYDDVLAGTGGTDKGIFAEASYDPEMLETGKTYYWRIDELIGYGGFEYWVEGDVWSFTISD